MNPSLQLSGGRTLMGDSLGFHIIFALLGVGLPLCICLLELLGLLRKDAVYYTAARRLTFAMSTLFVVGGISGLIISFQLNLLWPQFMSLAGQVIGLPFFLEGIAFFIEAIFLGIYVFSWDRFSGWTHWLCSLPVVLGSVASAFFITTANAFMNNPQGFTYQNGTVGNVHPWLAMFNPATPTETSHSILSYYLTTTLLLASWYALLLLRERKKEGGTQQGVYKKLLVFFVALSLVFSLGVGLSGDDSGKYLAAQEPLKLAAAEGLYQSQSDAPLRIGGLIQNNQLTDAIEIPGLLSLLAFGNTHAVVQGLTAFNPLLWPPLFIHYMFDAMAALGTILVAVPLLFFALRWKYKGAVFSRFMLWLLVLSGPLSLIAVECGWVLTEVGRQPYVIRGIMTTSQAFTTSTQVLTFAFIFPTLYLVLFAITYWVLRWHYKNPAEANRIWLPPQ